jgi:methyl-accepting chemotaxis protein
MKLTVSARIAGGFGVVVALLLVISIASLSGVNGINRTLESVVDEATPMLQTSGEIISTLLEANDQVNRHQKSNNLDELQNFEDRFESLKGSYEKRKQRLTELVSSHPDMLKQFKKSQDAVDAYFNKVPEIFNLHRKALTQAEAVKKKKSRFEDIADELDSLVYDLSEDLTSQDDVKTVQSIGNLIREGTISATDALNLDKEATINTVNRDLQAIVDSIQDKYKELSSGQAAASSYFSELGNALDNFSKVASGNDGLLATYISQLASANASRQSLLEAESRLAEAIGDLREVVNLVKNFADRSKEEAVDQVSGTQTLIITLALIAVVAAVFISMLVIKSIREPLNEVVDVIAKVAEGDLTQNIDVHREDEFGNLSNSMNHLTSKLREILGNIAESSQQLASSAEQTEAIARRGHESINTQREQTELVATAMAEMTATVNEVANSANNTLREVQGANEESNIGLTIVRDNIDTINRLANEIERAAQVINKLNEYSDNIGSVLDVIRGIADQTNLLALNAAIEAARAGEQGRGFAVVADEVRTLASKTQESTSEIQGMIERLQTGTKDAVSVMEKSQVEAKVSVEQTAKAGKALESITRAVGVINDMSTHIASSAEEQSAVTNEMHENITTISSLAEQNAQGANESLAASQQLARLAEQLQRMVAQFKV